ncbi:MAG: AmmeMemoRadiSam system protein A [Candidatus Adiutricales bacterium]
MEDQGLVPEEKEILLKLARFAIMERLGSEAELPVYEPSSGLNMPCGAFVSLHRKGQLRGCIGTFSAQNPLEKTVQEMARAAAFQDPRFAPVSESEIAEIDLEISALSPMREIEDIEKIEVGRHGLYVVDGPYSGVLLPQVAVEQVWDRYTFLEQTCLKAGLDRNRWRSGDIKIFVFSAQVFGE